MFFFLSYKKSHLKGENDMSTLQIVLICIASIGIPTLLIGLIVIVNYCKNPFDSDYPKKRIILDVSGKRHPSINDAIDEYIIAGGFQNIKYIQKSSEEYENKQRIEYANNEHRLEQLNETVAMNRLYLIIMQRKKTRYRQQNYVKYPYTVIEEVDRCELSFEQLLDIYKKLESINFEATRSDYNSKNQRRLMTRELRKKIMIRDNYRCQRCGKIMYDEVGLHIDHIIPVSKGGKTVESNLQVLCSKCNSSKSNKLI